jgi:hypothetical protein
MKMLLIFLSLSLNAFSLETDNYLTWGTELKDSSEKINLYLKKEINKALSEINSGSKPLTCFEVTSKIALKFRARFVHDNPIETWLLKNSDSNEFYPETRDYIEKSIYRLPYRFYLSSFGLAPNIQVNNIYFGMDKLTHFTSTGRHYFTIFHGKMKQFHSLEKAEKASIDYGLLDELTLHGFWASGVFSYADLEANYQGLQFYKNFCFNKNKNYLGINGENKWVLIKSPRIEDYVSPLWDETFNPSYFLPKNWKKILPTIKNEYCSMRKENEVRNRIQYYKEINRSSFSEHYIQSLKKQDSLSTPFDTHQTLANACKEN